MCPRAVAKRRPKAIPKQEVAKLWLFLVGVNQYQDQKSLPSLQYSALDCQGLGEALTEATETFPAREIIVHHDFANQKPTVTQVRNTLNYIVNTAQPQDTILFYFSGHGILEASTQKVVLCLTDTYTDKLLETGLPLQELLQCLGQCAASQQLVWLDACHSGGMTLRGTEGAILPNPTTQLVQVLRKKAAQSQGFYALLSCDQTQQSWEFPELGHGVFTYYLMRGLRGEAADSVGIIEADALYQYVYHQTLRYIDKTNQQIRLINQQKSSRGERQLNSEYPLQTPKRIVEGFGKVILGKRTTDHSFSNPRQALVIDGLGINQTTLGLSKILRGTGGFNLEYFPQTDTNWTEVRSAIARCLDAEVSQNTVLQTDLSTVFLYLRGLIKETETGESCLFLRDGVKLSRSWLRKILRNSRASQQIIILDCPGASSIEEWVEDLRLESDRGQCLIAAASNLSNSQQFTQALLETLEKADRQSGFPVAAWITQLQIQLAGTEVIPQIWLSGTRGVIEVLPGKTNNGNKDDSGVYDLGICPYMGLKAFTEENAEYFYGRDALIQKLLLQVNHSSTIAVVGASGSGKSSVVQAGLISQLRQGKQVPGSEQWWIGCLRPGQKPIQTLARTLVDGGTEKEKAQQQLQAEGLLYQGVEGFVQWLRSRSEPVVMLVIDQFEEIFTLAGVTDRINFLKLILGAIKFAGDRFKLILTVRADFVATCLEIPELAQILQQSSVLVPPYLTEEDYRSAVVKPAEQVGLKIESGLVELLLQDLDRSAGDLPLLQFVLQQLWENRQAGKLTLSAYQQLGGMKGALEKRAQEVYENLDTEAQACARWIFLNLTQLGEGTEDTRRRINKSDLVVARYPAPLVARTLQALMAAKLIVVNLDQGIHSGSGQSRSGDTPANDDELLLEAMKQEATIEVVHEILIRHWSTLRWWLEENRARLRSQRQIEQAALLWTQKGKSPDFLLRGVRLGEAEEIYIKYTDELTEVAREFIEAGIDAREAEQREAKRRLRRAQLTAATLGVLGLAATAFGGLAYRQKVLAEIENINTLNSSAEALLLSNQQLESILTSIKAGKEFNKIGNWGQTFVGRDNWETTKVKTVSTLQQALDNTQELNRLQGHSQKVNAVIYSPDGKLIATASDDGTIKIWHTNGQLITTLTGHQDRVTNLAFSNGKINLADLNREGKIKTSLVSDENQSQNNYVLASASADRTVRLWRIQNNEVQPLKTLTGHQDWVTDIAFSPDNQIIASASRDKTIKLWQLDGTLITTLSGHNGWVNTIDFASDNLLASGGEDNQIKLWQIDHQSSKELRTITGNKDRITQVKFSANGDELISASGDGEVKLWQVKDGQQINSFSHQDQVNSVAFTPDDQLIATATADGRINIWNKDGILQQVLVGHGGEITKLNFSPQEINEANNQANSYLLASASVDKTVKIWQINNLSSSEAGGIYSVAISPTSPEIYAAAGWDGKIQLWQKYPDQTKELLRTLPGHQTTIADLKFSPDGKVLASASWDKTIKLWRVADGSLITTLKGHQDGVNSIAFSPNGQLLVSGSEDRTVKIWQLNNDSAELLKTLERHQDSVKTIAISPDSQLIASGSYDKTIRIWNLEGKLLKTLSGHNLAISSLQFSKDGKLLASGSWDNTIRLWQIKEQNPSVQILSGHQDGITGIDFIDRDDILASSSADGTIKLWDLTTNSLLKTLRGHSSQINSLAISNDGQTLISADEQQGLFWWNLNLNNLVTQGCDRVNNYLEYSSNLSKGDRSICN